MLQNYLSKSLLQSKVKASLLHFLLSFAIFCVVLGWAWFFAYPSAYFTMAGAVQGLSLVFIVDVVLGPLLSFLVYNPKKSKKEIISDFAIIGVVQFAALIYGVSTLYQERPRAIILYPKSTATVISHRELGDFPELGDLSQYRPILGLPAPVLMLNQGKHSYQSLDQSADVLLQTSDTTRHFIKQMPDVQAELNQIDHQYQHPYIISVMAKYNGAYFALDKNMTFLVKFAERPIS